MVKIPPFRCRAKVQFLAGEVRSHMSQGMAKKLKNNNNNNKNYWLKKIFLKIKSASSLAKGDIASFDIQLWSQAPWCSEPQCLQSVTRRDCPAGERRGPRGAGSTGQRAQCTQMPFLSLLRYRTSG